MKKIFSFCIALYIACFIYSCGADNSPNSASNTDSSQNTKQTQAPVYNWAGTWIYTNDKELIDYKLVIDEVTMNRHECEFTGVGMQTDFKIHCRAYNFGDRIDIHFMSVASGSFADDWDINKPLFSLYLSNDKVFTEWKLLKYFDNPGIFFKR